MLGFWLSLYLGRPPNFSSIIYSLPKKICFPISSMVAVQNLSPAAYIELLYWILYCFILFLLSSTLRWQYRGLNEGKGYYKERWLRQADSWTDTKSIDGWIKHWLAAPCATGYASFWHTGFSKVALAAGCWNLPFFHSCSTLDDASPQLLTQAFFLSLRRGFKSHKCKSISAFFCLSLSTSLAPSINFQALSEAPGS